MYSEQEREQIRAAILERARNDARLTAAAITGSAAGGTLDAWSDVDLAFAVRGGVAMSTVLVDWTAYLRETHGAQAHVDVQAGAWVYRVFLLANTLQVDLAFVTETEFRAMAPTFRLVFGEAREAGAFPLPSAEQLIGFGWLYALHARSCIARGKWWQAEYMVSALRDTGLSLACLRHGLAVMHGRGFDLLPEEVKARFGDALVSRLDGEALSRAFGAAMDAFLAEVQVADAELAGRIAPVLRQLVA